MGSFGDGRTDKRILFLWFLWFLISWSFDLSIYQEELLFLLNKWLESQHNFHCPFSKLNHSLSLYTYLYLYLYFYLYLYCPKQEGMSCSQQTHLHLQPVSFFSLTLICKILIIIIMMIRIMTILKYYDDHDHDDLWTRWWWFGRMWGDGGGCDELSNMSAMANPRCARNPTLFFFVQMMIMIMIDEDHYHDHDYDIIMLILMIMMTWRCCMWAHSWWWFWLWLSWYVGTWSWWSSWSWW